MQRELPVHGSVTIRKKHVPEEVIRQLRNELAAINMDINLSGLTDEYISETLMIHATHFSRMRKGRAHFPPNKLNDLMDLCGSEVFLQYMAWRRRKVMYDDHMSQEEAEILARAEQIKARKAA
jgi:hypothetical protein